MISARTSCLVIMLVSLGMYVCKAQQHSPLTGDNATTASGDLPGAPSVTPDAPEERSNLIFGVARRTATATPARKIHRIVQPNEFGQPLSSGDKLKLAIVGQFTVSAQASALFSAGFSQMRDSSPHFGTDSGAFGERLGALALKQTTQSIFEHGIYAGLFHDDPRYYVMGREKNPGIRALYSASRFVITQTDDGKASINWPKFAGIVSAAALTNAYYPAVDHGFANGASAFCVSLGTSILNNEINEFIGDGLRLLRHHRN
jgi:hypothetical protein